VDCRLLGALPLCSQRFDHVEIIFDAMSSFCSSRTGADVWRTPPPKRRGWDLSSADQPSACGTTVPFPEKPRYPIRVVRLFLKSRHTSDRQ
jgi:hypothetical protein